MPAARTNRWDQLDPPPLGDWAPRLRASVVIPYFNAPEAIRKTLIGVAAQTYPRDLIEIIVVDDGSPTPLQASDVEDITAAARVVNRADEGFRLAAARNDGADHATGDVLVFLDHDMIPDPQWLESHMRWHHVSRGALVLGSRSHTAADWLTEDVVRAATEAGGLADRASGHEVQVPEWIEFHLQRTNNLTSGDEDIFRVVTGGNLSVSVDLFTDFGGFDESFVRWGGEDTEFGYRAWVSGALLIPEPSAHCWHQGLGVVPDDRERLSQQIQKRKLANLIPVPGFRDPRPGRSWQRPRVVAVVEGTGIGSLTATTESLLLIPDVMVVITSDDPLLIEDFGPDPRVVLSTDRSNQPSRFSPFLARIPAGLALTESLMDTLVERARRTGLASTSDGVTVESRRHVNADVSGAASVAQEAGRAKVGASQTGRVVARLRRIRSLSDLAHAGRWLMSAIGRRLPGRPGARARNTRPRPSPGPRRLAVDPWARVVAIDLPDLPATGRQDDDRVDLVVTASAAAELDIDASVVAIGDTYDPALLTYRPIEPAAALSAIRGTTVSGPLEDLLRGIANDSKPPGERTGQAWHLARSRDVGDAAALESIRRAVLSEHLTMMRLDQLRRSAGLPPRSPSVSAVIASRRPDRLTNAIEAIARQSYPDLEVVVASHGAGLSPSVLGPLQESRIPFVSLEAHAEMRLGSVLAMASRRASGHLLAKMDDDDLYACTHIEDLVNAYLLSNADLVGKGAEFVYLEQSDTTIRRFAGGAYTASRTIAGGAMAVTRQAYEEVGGWADVARHVDQAMLRDVLRSGGETFRTHGLGYVLVRHGDHTWVSDEGRFLDQAEERWSGLPAWITSEQAPDRCGVIR